MRIAFAGAMVLVACGDEPRETPDAGADPDAGVDAPMGSGDSLACVPTGGSGEIIVDGPSGSATLEVVFVAHDANGTVIGRSGVMGPDATTTMTVPSCGMVTVHQHDPAEENSKRALTWANVQPGDRLVHQLRSPALFDRDVQVQLPALAGATKYQITMACSSYSVTIAFDPQPGPVNLSPDCPPGAQEISVLALATTPTGARAALAPNAPLAATGTTVVTLPPYQPAQSIVANIRGASALANGYASVGTSAAASADRFVPVGSAQAMITAVDLTVGPVPVLAVPSMIVVNLRSSSTASPYRTAVVGRGLAANQTTIDVDVATDLLPNATGTLDAASARPALTWGAARPFTADLAVIDLDDSHDEAGRMRWRMIAPARPGTVRFPELPQELRPAVAQARLDSLALFESSALSSYDEARTRLFQMVQPLTPGAQLLVSETSY